MMDMSMGMNLLPQQQMKASPALIALNNMLVLSTQDLQQLVQAELEQNPALDQVESEEPEQPDTDTLEGIGTIFHITFEGLRIVNELAGFEKVYRRRIVPKRTRE